MVFPVDIESITFEELERSAHSYREKLRSRNSDDCQNFMLTTGRTIPLRLRNIGLVSLYGLNTMHQFLGLFATDDLYTAMALYLDDHWYDINNVLKTADPAREGLIKVTSHAERIVLYVLNRIIYCTKERTDKEKPFPFHTEDDQAKILWKNGEAVGFDSVKPKGSMYMSMCYRLPVMDTIFVRTRHRGKKHGLQMLEDFVNSFKEEKLGLSYPLTRAMSMVCWNYLRKYPKDVDLLWEVDGWGSSFMMTKVVNKFTGKFIKTEVRSKVMGAIKFFSGNTQTCKRGWRKRKIEERETSLAKSLPEKIRRVEESVSVAVVSEMEGKKGGEEAEVSVPSDVIRTFGLCGCCSETGA